MMPYDFTSNDVLDAMRLINDSGSQAEYIAASWAVKESSEFSGAAKHLNGRIVLDWMAENGCFFDQILADQWLSDILRAESPRHE